jgi:hypothetical protein
MSVSGLVFRVCSTGTSGGAGTSTSIWNLAAVFLLEKWLSETYLSSLVLAPSERHCEFDSGRVQVRSTGAMIFCKVNCSSHSLLFSSMGKQTCFEIILDVRGACHFEKLAVLKA